MANLEPQATFVDRFAGMIIIDELVNIYLNIVTMRLQSMDWRSIIDWQSIISSSRRSNHFIAVFDWRSTRSVAKCGKDGL